MKYRCVGVYPSFNLPSKNVKISLHGIAYTHAAQQLYNIIMWAGHIVYRIAGIFRGYKCSWFLQKSAIPQIHENLSKSISAKMFALEIYPLSGPYEPGELKVKWGGAPLQTFNSSYEAR